MWLRTSSEGQENAEDVRSNHITNTLPRFTPGPEFKESLERIKFTKASSASSEMPMPLSGDIREAPSLAEIQPE